MLSNHTVLCRTTLVICKLSTTEMHNTMEARDKFEIGTWKRDSRLISNKMVVVHGLMAIHFSSFFR